MGKWLPSGKPEGANDWIGFLDRGVKLEGTLDLAGTFRVDGEVTGTIRCKDRLIVGENAKVEGEIDSAIVSVAGKINGKIHGKNRVEILASGLVEGEIHTPTLVIEAGGVLEGRCHMRAETQPAKSKNPLGVPEPAPGGAH